MYGAGGKPARARRLDGVLNKSRGQRGGTYRAGAEKSAMQQMAQTAGESMQHITVIAVGKASGFYAQSVAEYAKRLQPLCRFTISELPEETIREKKVSAAQIQAALEKEGAQILAAVPKGATLVALCIEGKMLTSEAFCAMLDEGAQSGAPSVAFAIGSSHGLANTVKDVAALRISLSAMTLPHQLARLVLCEQIYRAMSIRAGTKYHK